jgi:hypothetical protein
VLLLKYEASHLVLFTGIDVTKTAQCEGTEKAVAAKWSLTVGFHSVLDIKVQHVFGQRPTKFKEATKLGACEIGGEKNVGANVEWCSGQREQFVPPQSNCSSSLYLLRDQANGPRMRTRIGTKFEVGTPNFSEKIENAH